VPDYTKRTYSSAIVLVDVISNAYANTNIDSGCLLETYAAVDLSFPFFCSIVVVTKQTFREYMKHEAVIDINHTAFGVSNNMLFVA